MLRCSTHTDYIHDFQGFNWGDGYGFADGFMILTYLLVLWSACFFHIDMSV